MPSKLFQFASAAVREAARKEFRQTQFARTVKDLSRAARGGALSSTEVARFSRRLSSLTGKRVADDLLKQLGLDEVERYAKRSGFGGAFGNFLDALGPVGSLIRAFAKPGKGKGVSLKRELEAAGALLRAFGHVVLPPAGSGSASRVEQEELANMLRTMGWKVIEPEKPETAAPIKRPTTDTDIDFGGRKLRKGIPNNDPLITGEMIPVTSSNVHSIGFRLDPNDNPNDILSSKGTLLIRFLQKRRGQAATAGATYEYFDVPAAVFQAFRRAASKGEFVWDNIRVRGSVSGHKYSYDLAGIVGGYVPRQAGLKRGQQGEWYMTRRFREGSNVFTSRLPEQQVSGRGPNRAEPNRGLPNRGIPNRGR